jgi:protein-S-isoprenylcysteine O-methyltransferase Ste14
LGSLWTLIPAAALTVLIIIRTYLEDKMLHSELEGYKEYAEKVLYRLIPGIW